MVGLIRDNNEVAYREEVRHLANWCKGNNLILNVSKTKEIIVDFRRSRPIHTPLLINDSAVEVVSSAKFLGVHITDNLSWSPHISSLAKKGQQRLHFLRRMKRASLPPPILQTFYRGTIESLLTSCISIWAGNCKASDWKSLQRVTRTGEKIIGSLLPCIKDIADKRCLSRAHQILSDPAHPNHGLFSTLPSGRRYRNISCRTTRLLNSFFPRAVRLLNST